MTAEKTNDQSTRQRLIEAAGELFAATSFKETTVREICDKAGANIAAVNYHFGDKEKLYEQVILHILQQVKSNLLLEDVFDRTAAPEVRLYTIMRTFLMRRFDPERPEWLGILASREMFEPSSALRSFMNQERLKALELLVSIVEEVADSSLDPGQVKLCVDSIMGQFVIYVAQHSPHSPIPIEARVVMDREMIESVARHIAEFSIAGIKCVKALNTQ